MSILAVGQLASEPSIHFMITDDNDMEEDNDVVAGLPGPPNLPVTHCWLWDAGASLSALDGPTERSVGMEVRSGGDIHSE